MRNASPSDRGRSSHGSQAQRGMRGGHRQTALRGSLAAVVLSAFANTAQAETCTAMPQNTQFCTQGSPYTYRDTVNGAIVFFTSDDIKISFYFVSVDEKFSGQQALYFQHIVQHKRDKSEDIYGRPVRNWQGDTLPFQDSIVHRSIYTKDRFNTATTYATSTYILGENRVMQMTTTQQSDAFTPTHDAAHKDALARIKLD